MMFIKLSIAIFLLRIATKRRYAWTLKISMVVVTVWSLATFLFDTFQCMPVAAQWDFTITDGKCAPGNDFVAAAYAISVMTMYVSLRTCFRNLERAELFRVQSSSSGIVEIHANIRIDLRIGCTPSSQSQWSGPSKCQHKRKLLLHSSYRSVFCTLSPGLPCSICGLTSS